LSGGASERVEGRGGGGEEGTWQYKDAWELWDIVQGRGYAGLGYTVLRHREFGTVVELFHDSDDGFFRCA
jgi:hypothetical protein